MSEKKLPGLILLYAFLIRVIGIGFGLPNLYHQDEPIIANHALAIGVNGWNPHFFVLPPLVIYVLFLIFGCLFAAGRLSGVYPNAETFGLQFLSDPTVFYWSGRFVLGVLLGVAAVWMVYRISRDRLGKNGPLYAALFMGTAYLPAAHSHYIYADCALVFFVAGVFHSYLNFIEKKSIIRGIYLAIWIALAMATKYTAAYLLPGFLLAYFIWDNTTPVSNKSVQILWIGVLSAVLFACLAPYTFLDWSSFWGQIRSQSSAQGFVGYGHHLLYSLANGYGWTWLLLAAAGFFFWLKERIFLGRLIFLQIIVYYGVNIFFSQPFARYMLPLSPLLCIASAHGLTKILTIIPARSGIKTAMFALLLLTNVIPLIYLDTMFMGQDTRDRCKQWIEREVPQGSVLVRNNRFFSPQLLQTPEQLREKISLLGPEDRARQLRWKALSELSQNGVSYEIYSLRSPGETVEGAFLSEKPYVAMDWGALKGIGAQYLIINTSTRAGEAGEEAAWLKRNQDKLELVQVFSPFWSKERKEPIDPYSLTAAPDSLADLFSRTSLGPYLEIYRIKND